MAVGMGNQFVRSLGGSIETDRMIDGVVNAISRFAVAGSGTLRKVQTGVVQTYATVIIAAMSAILFLMYLLGGLR